MKQFGKPLFLREPPPPSTNPPISEQFFHDPPLSPNFKKERLPLILGGRKLWSPVSDKWKYTKYKCILLKNDKKYKRI